MARYQFGSPGAASARAIAEEIDRRAMKQRQDMLDKLALDREARLVKHDEQQLALGKAQLESVDEARKLTATKTKADVAAADVKRLGSTYRIGDRPGAADAPRAGELGLVTGEADKQLAARSLPMSVGAPGIMGDVQGPPSPAPVVAPQISKQVDAGAFRGTSEQRIANALKNDPSLTPQQRQFMAMQEAAGVGGIPAALFETDDDTPVVRASADKRTLEQYVGGQWVPVKGNIPKGARMLQEAQPPAEVSVNLGGDALDMAAWQYLQTGVIPSNLGRGGVTQAAVITRAAEISKDAGGINPVANAASNAADRSALTQITRNMAAISAFKNTARKNIEVLKATTKTIADTGIPFLNRPVREALRMTGSTDIAAFRTALGAVQPEVGRILTNPNLTGVLTDSARAEVQQLLSGDYTVAQLMTALGVLEQDMKNRETSLAEAKAGIEGSIRSRGPQQEPGIQSVGTSGGQSPAAAPGETPEQRRKRLYDSLATPAGR